MRASMGDAGRKPFEQLACEEGSGGRILQLTPGMFQDRGSCV